MIKIISKSLALLALLFLSFDAVAQEICIPQIPNQTYDIQECPVSSIPGITNQSVASLAFYTPISASIINSSGNPVNSNNIAQFVDACGQPLATEDTYHVRGSFGSHFIQLKATGSTGWVNVRVYYENGLGGSTTRNYSYFFFNPSSYNGNNPTSFSAAGSSFCPAPYTKFVITRSSLPIFRYELQLQEVDALGQVVSGGVSWSSGTVFTEPDEPGVNLLINPQALGFSCQANKRYKITLKTTTACGTNASTSAIYLIGDCKPAANSSVIPQGTNTNDNGTVIPSFCSANTRLPVTLSTSLPSGAPAISLVKLYLQEMTASNCVGAIGGETPSGNLTLASSYDLRAIPPFSSLLPLNGAQVKYFRIRAEISNAIGTTSTGYKCFRITNDQLVVPGFDFTTAPGSGLDIGIHDGIIPTVPLTSDQRGFLLGTDNCGIRPNISGIYDNYRVEILRLDRTATNPTFLPFFDSGIKPFPIYAYPFNNPDLQYFNLMTTVLEKNMYDYKCRLSVSNDCGWVSYTQPFHITPFDCIGCRTIDNSNPTSEQLNNKANFDGADIVTPNISISPNPTEGIAYFSLMNTLPNTESYLQILNLEGQIISSQVIPANNDVGQMDLSMLPTGLYLYRFIHANKIISGKLIKN